MLDLTILRAARLGWALIALAAFGSALADDLQDAARLVKDGQHKQALALVDKVLAAKPGDAQARFLKGLIFTEQGKSKEAIEIFTQLTKDYPELPEPYNNLAVIYASQGQYDKARAALEQSIRTHPSYATAYENLGDVYAKLASQAYDKALQIDSSNAAAKNKLSLVRELVGRPVPTATVAVAAAKPKPAGEKPAPPASDLSAEVLKTLDGWAQAWSRKDADAYLAYYARDFKTPGGEARASWEKTRRARVTAPKSISVSLASPKVTMSGADRATVTFRQSYRSDVLKANSTKTLVLLKVDGGWKILEEKSG